MGYEQDYNSKSIWGEEGPPHAYDDGEKDAIKHQGKEMPYNPIHTKKYLEGYKKGAKEYKEIKMEKLLKGEIGEDMSKEEIDEFLGRKTKISKGGIILP